MTKYRVASLQQAAKLSLELNNKEMPLGSGHHLQVKLSDPTRRQNRTDANANQKELFITGLPRYAKEADLHKLFETVGTSNSCYDRLVLLRPKHS